VFSLFSYLDGVYENDRVIDRIGLPWVARFVTERLAAFDLSRLDWFKLLPLKNDIRYRGLCQHPIRPSSADSVSGAGYRVTASVQPRLSWPFECRLVVEWQHVRNRQGRIVRRPAQETVIFTDPSELLIQVAGHEAFHFLCHSGQIVGTDAENEAERFGLEWLKEWRRL
jgi:hypothetical protein